MKVRIRLIQNYVFQDFPSIIVNCDDARYVFNVPSTFQRFYRDHKIYLRKISNHFFTKTSAQTIAGLNGLMLTKFQLASYESKLFLSRPMFQYLQDARYKMGYKILPFSYFQWENPKQRSRIGIRNKLIIQQLVCRQDFKDIFDDIDTFIRKQVNLNDINDANTCYSEEIQGFKDKNLEIIPFFLESKNEQIINYICRTNPVKGKVLIEKVKQLGIPQKFIQRILQAKTFKLPNCNRIMQTSEIKQPDSPGRLFFILHINSIQSIEKILADKTFKKFTSNQVQFIDCVIFIIQQTTYLLSEQFRNILKVFPASCNHIIQAPNTVDNNFRIDTFIKPHMMLVSKIHQRFPMCMPDIVRMHQSFMLNYLRKSINIEQLFDGYNMSVLQKSDQVFIPSLGQRTIFKNVQKPEMVNPLKELKNYLRNINPIDTQAQLPFKSQLCDPKIVFLGTGSKHPRKYRNLSSILVQYDKNNYFLLDCGQASMYQMINHYPLEEADQILLNVRVLFITHMHSDHSLGILDLISRRNGLMKKYKDLRRIFLIIPCNMYPWYSSFLKNIEDLSQGCDLLFTQSLTCQPFDLNDSMFSEQQCKRNQLMYNRNRQSKNIQKSFNQQKQTEQQIKTKKYLEKMQLIKQLFKKQEQVQPETLKLFKDYLKSINVSSFNPIRVLHCPQSYGIIIQNIQANIKISYSGDTRPFDGFTKAALNSTLMIHQATFNDDVSFKANTNFHSTVSQAIKIGMNSKSWKTALTHFSQKQQKANFIVDEKNYPNNKQMQNYVLEHTIVCFDHLQFKLSDAAKLPQMSQNIQKSINLIK